MRSVGKYHNVARRILFGAALAMLSACSGENKPDGDTKILVQLGEDILTTADVSSKLPGGLTPDDSVKYVRAYAKGWIEAKLISNIASGEIDMTEINRLTEEYRNSLIMMEYRRRMFAAHADAILDDTIKSYYDQHKADFVLERPLVKGVYLKVPDDASNLATLKRLYISDRQNDIDRLEKEVLTSAIHYDYFRDHWIDWEQIENKIPYDFGQPLDKWLRTNRKLDTSLGGFTYLLMISEVLPIGSPMPFEAAKQLIIGRIQNTNRQAYDAQLTRGLYDQALQSGKLIVNIPLD